MTQDRTTVHFRKTLIGEMRERIDGRLWRFRKGLVCRLTGGARRPKRVVLVVGCQRSGTTLLGEVFDYDSRTIVLQEDSCLTDQGDRYLRLKPFDEVNRLLGRMPYPIAVVKPLVESHRTCEMLAEIAGSKAIWMYRHYRDVANSNVKRFTGQVERLGMSVTGDPPSWRSEGVSVETRQLLRRFLEAHLTPHEAAALGWYSVNVTYFEQSLAERPDVMRLKYEDLVAQPHQTMQQIYSFLGLDLPKKLHGAAVIDARSVGFGSKIALRPEIRALCEEVMERLDRKRRFVPAPIASPT